MGTRKTAAERLAASADVKDGDPKDAAPEDVTTFEEDDDPTSLAGDFVDDDEETK